MLFQLLLCPFNRLDMNIVTSKLLIVSWIHLHTLVPCSDVTKLACVVHRAISRKDCVSGGDAVVVLTESGAETVLYKFIRVEAKQVVVHELFWKPLSKSLVSFFALVGSFSLHSHVGSLLHYVLLECVSIQKSSYQERALVNAP